MKKIILKAGEGKRIKSGHKWVFSNEIKNIEGSPTVNDIVALYDNDEALIGFGFYNPHSLIAFRLLSTVENEDINIAFWEKRIASAKALREKVYPNEKSYRAIFGESDNMSGVIIDKYGDYLCAQFVCAGADFRKADILEAAKLVYNPKGIFIRNDAHLRQLENANLKAENEIYFGEISEDIIIEENGLKFYADIVRGQKTGYFFDQRDNRLKLANYVKDKKVLDCYCHTGAFAIYAKKAGAKEVVFVDSSLPALETAEKNYNLNGLKDYNGVEADALEYLQSKEAKSEKFDIVNIDPPGLIKSRKDFNAGFKHYVKVNEAAISLLRHGGILATSSCSHHLNFKDFKEVISQAAAKAKREAVILEYGFQSKDHPILASMQETEYLNFAIVLIK
ncbi:class I SAM-dependent rRNA methyltransferase [Endomicrobium proavitum]|uniref:SAM-dependent methyltransferase n=1 Tax=Endomicrobium proavitum TaxID=1408281 RepID=A0A0G3WI15_9BACT|nr:class I SAM-dependent rRNA methyltransferase [Endomicrobium proavitum]AKL98331.1 SAM-dependent methyltransferase [Endomicrobium proavitum]